ncbi:hypothetical protein [Cribrihabitans neustonicus]|uniref:hypothetical protein n=1 Tax=Cribrihabitans neustonicus TaxID=1429085 RepID=UPI003B5AD8AE
MIKKITVICTALILSGCVSRVNISEIESVGGDYFALNSTDAILSKGLAVGNGYLLAADKVSAGIDAVAVATIVLAAGAATAVINGASDQSILRAGVAGVAGGQVVGHFNPVDARNALTRAANRQYCIVAEASPISSANDPNVNAVLARGFNSIRIALRSDLNREPQSYSALLAQYRTSVEVETPQTLSLQPKTGRTLSLNLEEFKRKILDCVGLT